MASINPTSSIGDLLNPGGLNRFPPEPKSNISKKLWGMVNNGLRSMMGGGGLTTTIAPEYAALIEKQMEVQQQMQLVSLASNTEKARHESRMAAIRNVRAA